MAVNHLVKLLEAGWEIGRIDGCCHFCGAWPATGEPHPPDCPYLAAKAFIDGLTPQTADPDAR